MALLPNLAAGPSVAATALVWATGNGGSGTQGVATNVLQNGCFEAVDAIDADFVPLSTLVTYDAVLYFSNQNVSQNPTLIGNVLADYADTGRRLVLATFSWAGLNSNTLGGRLVTDEIAPLLRDGFSLYTHVTMMSNDGSGYFAGVNSVVGQYHDNVRLATGATQRASWSDGEPLLADKGNVVAIDLFPDDSYGHLGGDYQRLFGNAMCFAAVVPVRLSSWGSMKTRHR